MFLRQEFRHHRRDPFAFLLLRLVCLEVNQRVTWTSLQDLPSLSPGEIVKVPEGIYWQNKIPNR